MMLKRLAAHCLATLRSNLHKFIAMVMRLSAIAIAALVEVRGFPVRVYK